MKKYLLFENIGHVEVMGLFMIGASTKRNDKSKIGRFGSGFKYSLAKILRDNLEVRIFAGEEEITIEKKQFDLRGESFNAIVINGQQTSLTTDMGPDWKWWQVLRELWCNALDEGNADLRRNVDHVQGRDGYTRVYLETNDEIDNVLMAWDEYFTHDRDDIILDATMFKVYRASNNKHVLYRKGIRCHASENKALYHYDYEDYTINEERVITGEFDAGYKTADMLAKFATVEIAANILKMAWRESTSESDFGWGYVTLNNIWREAALTFDYLCIEGSAGHFVDKLAKSDNFALVNKALAEKLMALGLSVLGMTPEGKKAEWIVLEPHQISKKQEFLLKDTLEALQTHLDYQVKYDIRLVEFTSENTLAKCDINKQQILLSPKLFDMGRRQIAMAIMEEQEHIYNKLEDETRGFQNHLFNKWLATMEERSGYFF